MPNFHTHWLVAIDTISDMDVGYIDQGYNIYHKSVKTFGHDLKIRAQKVKTKADFEKFKNKFYDILDNCQKIIKKNYDTIIPFSAFTLGACGPDFWTLASIPPHKIIPDFATIHFDFGHYNRSHRQFQVAINRWNSNKRFSETTLQGKVERAYFLGMATHIATDLVVHQLVNVYAGAYNLLEKKWENEHGWFTKDIWSTHNKVEHFWDTYIRYRFLSDYGEFWPGIPAQPFIDKGGWIKFGVFPSVPSLKQAIKNNAEPGRSLLMDWFDRSDVRYEIEKYLILPRIFCDVVVDGDKIGKHGKIKPFIYEIVAAPNGAYPDNSVFKKARDEKRSFQMQDILNSKCFNEKKKLRFFTTSINRTQSGKGWSCEYLTRIVCPSLERVRGKEKNGKFEKSWGLDTFYHTDALRLFILAAKRASKIFTKDLYIACKAGVSNIDNIDLGRLGKFWNLDTGLGINISHDGAKTNLSFIHINSLLPGVNGASSGYQKHLPYLSGLKKRTWKKRKVSLVPKTIGSISLVINIETSIEDLQNNEKQALLFYNDNLKGINEAIKHDNEDDEGTKKWIKSKKTKLILYNDNGVAIAANKKFQTELSFNLQKSNNPATASRTVKNRFVKNFKSEYGRNFSVALGRDNILHPNGDGNFWADDDFDYYGNISPSEHIFFSLFPIVQQGVNYIDLISGEVMNKKKLTDLRVIECLGVVKIVLVYSEKAETGKLSLNQCFIDDLSVQV